MPRLSAFTRFGLLRYSSAPSEGEKIYKALKQGYIDPRTGKEVFDLSKGSHMEAKIYATAMSLAAARAVVQRANNQNDPTKAWDSLTAWEKAFGLVPSPVDDVPVRRDNVAARARINRGSRREAMEDGLRKILGTNFIAYRTLSTDEANIWPTDPSLGPGVFGRPELPPKTLRLLDPVTTTGAPSTIDYETWDGRSAAQQLIKGDVLSVEPENLGLTEKVTVTSATATSLTATFANAHDAGCAATTGPCPIWWSTKRIVLIVVAHAAAVDTVSRNRVSEFMARAARAVTQWSIVQPSSPGATTIGPFALDTAPLGAVPIGTLSIIAPARLSLDHITPTSGSTAGGTTVTAVGTGMIFFTEAGDIKVAGVGSVSSIMVVDDYTLTFVTPAAGAGAKTIEFRRHAADAAPFATAAYTYV